MRYLFYLLLATALWQCGKKETIVRASYKTITEAVYASGNIMPAQEYTLFAMAEGYITEKLVSEGENVKPAQTLFRLKHDAQDFRAQNAQANLRIAQENFAENSPALQEIRIAIQNSQTRLQNDSIHYNRFKNLWEKQATSKIEHDRALLAYQNTQNDYRAQLARLQNTRNRLYLDWQNAQTNYNTQIDDQSNYTLTAKGEGTIYEIYKEVGETVRRGEPIGLIGTRDNLILRLEIDESDIYKIKIGQEVLVKADAYQGKIFKARVGKIFKRLNRQNQSFRVEASFVGEYPTDLAGLTVEANILINKKEKALVVPKDVLLKGDSLWIQDTQGARKIKIQKGLENYDFVEVLQGIDAQTVILKR